jgi:hypothetical protein
MSSTRSLLTWGKKRFGRGFGLLAGLKDGKVSESGMLIGVYGQKDLGSGARSAERKLRAEKREGLDVGDLLLFFSEFTEGVEIPENVRVKHAIKQPF